MTQKNDFDDSIDPGLKEQLKRLSDTPGRDVQSAARSRSRFLAQADALGHARSHAQFNAFLSMLTFNHISNQIHDRKDGYTMTARLQKIAVISAVVVVAVMLLLFSGGAMTAYASRAALPGDALYTVKTGIERSQLTFSTNPAAQAELHLQFAQRRLDEMSALINEGRFNNVSQTTAQFEYHVQQAFTLVQTVAAANPAQASSLASQVSTTLAQYSQTLNSMLTNVPENTRSSMTRAMQVSTSGSTTSVNESGEVEFTGTVEVMNTDSWTVSGRVLAITPDTQIEGVIKVGDTVQVTAFTAPDGTLTAREIQLEEEGNANTNDNQNGNVNGNGNGNVNINSNKNGNTNENDNEDVNDNENDNENENENGNSNQQHHENVEFSGAVDMISAGSWTIAGRTVTITPDTKIEGLIVVGSLVDVEASVNPDGTTLTALKIELSGDQEGNSNGNINGNINSNENENHNGNSNENDNENDHEGNHNSNVNFNSNSNHNGNDNENDGGGGD